MSEYKELYDKLKRQLELLEKQLTESKRKKSECERERNISTNEENASRKKIDNLKSKCSIMLNSVSEKVNNWAPLLLLAVTAVLCALYIAFPLKLGLIPWLSSVVVHQAWTVILGGIAIVGGGLGIFGVCLAGMSVLSDTVIKKLVDKVQNSKEYKELLEKIEAEEKQIDLSEEKVKNKDVELDKLNEEIEHLTKEIREVTQSMEYLEDQMNPDKANEKVNSGSRKRSRSSNDEDTE